MKFFSKEKCFYITFDGFVCCLKFTQISTLFVLILFVLFFTSSFLCEGIYEKFANALRDAVLNMKVGDGFSEDVAQVVIGLFLF